ncbi:hypothetical protein [Streptomyces sp. NPDC060031]|uniref:hypothetical protein n=1 Tax=Streptomyces sp. NPDC060031 TaxID=3347043 RepID=UPI0036AD51F1
MASLPELPELPVRSELLQLLQLPVRSAVVADREDGAGRAQTGAGLGISAEAARSRFGRMHSPPTVAQGR